MPGKRKKPQPLSPPLASTSEVKESASTAISMPSTPKKLRTAAEMDETGEGLLSPSKVSQPMSGMNLEAVLASVSPIKNKRFIGELVDNKKAIGFVGFDPGNQAKLEALKSHGTPVLLKNCDVQLNSWTKKLEVVVRSHTEVVPSDSQFNIDNIDNIGATPVSLSQLHDLPEFTKVNVTVKVISIKDPEKTGKNLRKQEVTIADNCVLTLWENHIDSLSLGENYQITKLTLRLFNGDRTLSMPRVGSKVEQIEDIGEVNEYTVDPFADTVEAASIIGVKDLQVFKACLFCNGKMEEDGDGTGKCTKCAAIQILAKCPNNEMAKVTVEGPHLQITTLVMYADHLNAILDGKPTTAIELLKAKPFNVVYNKYHVVTSVSR